MKFARYDRSPGDSARLWARDGYGDNVRGGRQARSGRTRLSGMKSQKPTARSVKPSNLKVVAGLVEGKSVATIAHEAGVSRQTISRLASSGEIRQMLVEPR